MRRFVLVSLISLISVVAFAGNTSKKEATTASSTEYSIEKVVVANQEINNFPYATANFKNDVFQFTSEGENPMVITYNWMTKVATVIANGQVSKVKADLRMGFDGKMVLTYGGYTIYLDKVRG